MSIFEVGQEVAIVVHVINKEWSYNSNQEGEDAPGEIMMEPKCKDIRASLRHVGIEISDLMKSRKFYEVLSEALGLKHLYESKETIGWGNKEFQIWIAVSETPRIKREPPTGEEMVVSEHLAIYVTDKESVDAVDEVMKKGGFSPLFPPEEHPEFSPGYYSASYCDPDNYVIEIFTFPEKK